MDDNIFLEDLEFFCRCGLGESERISPQKFFISLRIFGDFSAAMESDSIADTVNYSAVYDIVKGTVDGNEFRLIERLAGEISSNIFSKFQMVSGAEITIKKAPSSWSGRKYGSVGFSAKFTH
jgi:dihydroneopterin aldolase